MMMAQGPKRGWNARKSRTWIQHIRRVIPKKRFLIDTRLVLIKN